MNNRTEQQTPDREYRVFDEFDVSKAMLLPYTDDDIALIETAVAYKLMFDMQLDSEGTLIDTSYGYEYDECRNLRMSINAISDDEKTTMAIDVTSIVETILTLLHGLMSRRVKTLQDSYDLLHHQGAYADSDANEGE